MLTAEELALVGPTASKYILAYLRLPNPSQANVARELGVTRQAASKQLSKVDAQDLIRTAQSRRTDKAVTAQDRVVAQLTRLLDELEGSDLSLEDRLKAMHVLSPMLKTLEPYLPSEAPESDKKRGLYAAHHRFAERWADLVLRLGSNWRKYARIAYTVGERSTSRNQEYPLETRPDRRPSDIIADAEIIEETHE